MNALTVADTVARVARDLETNLPVNRAVHEAYQYSSNDIEYLYHLWRTDNPDGGNGRPDLSLPEIAARAANLYSKLCIEDEEDRQQRLHEFAHWLFTGEPARIVSSEPVVIQCVPFPAGCNRTFQRALFPFWPTDARCGLCIQRASNPSLGTVKRARTVAMLHEMLPLGRSKHIDSQLGRFVRAFSRMVQKEGDIEGIADHWHQWFKACREDPNKANSATLGNAYLAVMKLWLEVDKQRDQQANFEDMDDEELKEFVITQTVSRLTREQVEKLVEEATGTLGQFLEDGLEEEIYAEKKPHVPFRR